MILWCYDSPVWGPEVSGRPGPFMIMQKCLPKGMFRNKNYPYLTSSDLNYIATPIVNVTNPWSQYLSIFAQRVRKVIFECDRFNNLWSEKKCEKYAIKHYLHIKLCIPRTPRQNHKHLMIYCCGFGASFRRTSSPVLFDREIFTSWAYEVRTGLRLRWAVLRKRALKRRSITNILLVLTGDPLLAQIALLRLGGLTTLRWQWESLVA